MKKSDTRSAILRGLYHYVLFFLLVAFLVSSTMSLFVSTLSDDLGITLTGENLSDVFECFASECAPHSL